ncbi:MAG: T9SS type A sorting domain-containing protein, partial [Calditrichaeota bacterium]|nr:T9SS type A sorting domain-containing protein [Calditrichota bacterium]
VNDPVIAMIEVTNENSLFRMWRDGKLKHFSQGGDLTLRHVRMLDSLWQTFLINKYGTTENLRAAWNAGSRSAGTKDYIYDGGFEKDPTLSHWQLELHNSARGRMGVDTANPFEGLLSAKVSVTQSNGINWHIQWKQTGLSLKKDSLYTVSFAARAKTSRKITVAVMKDVSPWTAYLVATIQLTSNWKTFVLSFRSSEECVGNVRLSFELGAATGTTWFDEIHMKTSGAIGLAPEESLENRTVERIDYTRSAGYTDNRVKDMTAFYLKLEDDFFADMTRYLKNDLHVRCPIVGTNWNVGVGDLVVQSKLDYVDNHAYWDHPQFPHVPWSPTDWFINNQPMVKDEDGGTIPYLFGGVGYVGKPFTVSEYNHPFPNRYQTEGVLFLTSYASFYNSDAIMFFDYSDVSDDWETDKIGGYFSLHRNTAMMALMPSCAYAFREGWIQPSREEIHLNYSRDQVLLSPKKDAGSWQGLSLFPRKIALQHAVRNASFDSPIPLDPGALPPPPQNPYRSDTGELLWDTQGIFQVETPRFIGVTGFLQNFPHSAVGGLLLESASDFATLTWVSLTGDSLSRARRSLITLSTKAQNTGMVWDGIHTVHNHWGGPPTQLKPVGVKLSLAIQADSIRLFPLDERGHPTSFFKTYFPDAEGRFTVRLNQNTDQTVWFGIEALGLASHIGEPREAKVLPRDFWVSQNYPNPVVTRAPGFRGTTVAYFLPKPSDVRIEMVNILGQRIFSKQFHRQREGTHQFVWQGTDEDGHRLQSGVYFLQIICQTQHQTKEIVRKILLFNGQKID